MKNRRQFVFYHNKKGRRDEIKSKRETKLRETSNFIPSDATKFITCLALVLDNRKNGGFLLV